MELHHKLLTDKARELASRMLGEPLANSGIDAVENAGEQLKFLADYCDRLRNEYETQTRRVVARIEIEPSGKSYKIHYMSLQVGIHDLYAKTFETGYIEPPESLGTMTPNV
jgi:hypothetical protein